jgi:hypothetical protein
MPVTCYHSNFKPSAILPKVGTGQVFFGFDFMFQYRQENLTRQFGCSIGKTGGLGRDIAEALELPW